MGELPEIFKGLLYLHNALNQVDLAYSLLRAR